MEQSHKRGPERFVLLSFLSLTILGCQYAFNNPQALQTTLQDVLNIEEPQFQMFYTIFALPNLVTAAAFGCLIDWMGARTALVLLAIATMFSQAIIAVGGFMSSYSIILLGRMALGIASESLVTAQACLIAKWFKGRQLAFAFGISITLPELGNALNSYLTPHVYQMTRNLGATLMLSTFVCLLSTMCAVAAAFMDKRMGNQIEELNMTSGDEKCAEGHSGIFNLSILRKLRMSYWLIVIMCTFGVAEYVSFMDNVNRLLVSRFAFQQVSAGRAITITYLVAASASIPLGLLIDKIGCRRYFICTTLALFTVAHLIFYIHPQGIQSSHFGIEAGLFLLGLCYSLYANCFVPSIPLVVSQEHAGIAFGIMQMIENISLSAFPLMTGNIINSAKSDQIGYQRVSLFYVGLGLLGLLGSIGFTMIPTECKRRLDATAKVKQQAIEEASSPTENCDILCSQSLNSNFSITAA